MRIINNILDRFRPAINYQLLILLICTDVVFLLLHFFYQISHSPNSLLNLGTEGGYSELFQYIKEYWIAMLLFGLSWRTREVSYTIWALLFTYLLMDDAFQFHERAGKSIAGFWEYSQGYGLIGHEIGQVVVSLLVGCFFLTLIAYFYFRSSNYMKIATRDFATLLGLLVFFGIFIDTLHAVFSIYFPLVTTGLTMIEDGGEMFTMSIIVSYAAKLMNRCSNISVSLWQLITKND